MYHTRKRILEFVRSFIKERGYAPSIREIVKGCGISTPSIVQYHLRKLEKEGFIKKDPKIIRGIKLIEREFLEIPLLGTISAGKPLPIFDPAAIPEKVILLPADIVGRKRNLYGLRVKGMSMRDAFIMDGDIVIMEAKRIASNGEMVGVWLKKEQEVTLKKIYFEEGLIRLQPANEEMEPIFTEPENVEIQGSVIAVIRKIKG